MQRIPRTPETALTALYELISGPADLERDWSAVRALFYPGARLIVAFTHPDDQTELREWTPDSFAVYAAEDYRRRGGVWERELVSVVEHFGSIAHVWSSYETRQGSPDAKPIARGVNSVQLVRGEGRWWICSLVFDIEQPYNPIPPEYTGQPASTESANGG